MSSPVILPPGARSNTIIRGGGNFTLKIKGTGIYLSVIIRAADKDRANYPVMIDPPSYFKEIKLFRVVFGSDNISTQMMRQALTANPAGSYSGKPTIMMFCFPPSTEDPERPGPNKTFWDTFDVWLTSEPANRVEEITDVYSRRRDI